MKPFRRGLVVGKFSPLHLGHELVIRRAGELCSEVVLISYANPEHPGCGLALRERWLAERFPAAIRLVIADGPERQVPRDDADEVVHRRFVGQLCREILKLPVDAVFTSEDYGDGFARELTAYFRDQDYAAAAVQHFAVDPARKLVPISGTDIRADVHANRSWLAPTVYASFVKRICLLGGESTGKSTLAEELAIYHGTSFAAEYGRELWATKHGKLEYEDLLAIGREQVRREEQCAGHSNRYLFCDTSPLTTLFYSMHLFGFAEPELEQLAGRPYDLTVLCCPDIPFHQDGTRQEASFRMLQHAWYLQELKRRNIPFMLAIGTLTERMQQVGRKLSGT